MDFLSWARGQADRVGAVAAVIGGFLLLVVGWFGVSGELYPAAQLPYVVSGGLGGLFLLTIGTTLWLSADLRDEWRELRRIREELVRRGLDGEAQPGVAGVDAAGAVIRNGSRRAPVPSPPPSAREA